MMLFSSRPYMREAVGVFLEGRYGYNLQTTRWAWIWRKYFLFGLKFELVGNQRVFTVPYLQRRLSNIELQDVSGNY
ncbi:hypothetical protein RRG08_030627 [Elysia crispata]|uniref:Uncharacterized protein n=1 Tax=Elysia crispata TaxID=231223 RepID=A0AAE0Y2K4_9GAST|nr:hypothetical protein RRG08_030627 [Elysia crispata]